MKRSVLLLPLLLILGCEGPEDPVDDTGSGGGGGDDTGDPEDTADTGETGDTGTTGGSFTETFDDNTNVDTATSTARVADGEAQGIPRFDFLPAGDGSDGSYTPTASENLAAGVYNFTDMTVQTGITITSDGDLTLYVGTIDLAIDSVLDVAGDLTIVSSGATSLCGDFEPDGGITIHTLSTTDTALLGCGDGETWESRPLAGNSGGLELFAMGPLQIDSLDIELYTGSEPTSGVGAGATVFTAGTAAFNIGSIYNTNDDDEPGGGIGMYGLSTLDADYFDAYEGGSATTGGKLEYGYVGDIHMTGGYAVGGNDAETHIVTEGALLVDDAGFIYSEDSYTDPSSVVVEAASITLADLSFIYGGDGVDSPAGDVHVRSTGDLTTINSSYIYAGAGDCGVPGDVFIEAGGNVSTGATCYVFGGDADCIDNPGGNITIDTAGTLTTTELLADALVAGSGSTDGVVTVNEGATVSVTPEVSFTGSTVLVSVAMDLDGATSGTVTAVTPETGDGLLEISLAGDDTWIAAADAIGETINDGWRYRVTLDHDHTTSDALAGFSLTWE